MLSKNSLKNGIFYSGFLILSFLVTMLILSSIIFLFRGTITKLIPIFSAILSFGILFIFNRKSSKAELLIGGILGIIVFFISIIVSQNIYDFAHDSNWYHKAALGSLANGWNPVYDDFFVFADSLYAVSSVTTSR